ncbi:hypothetical protein T01_5053 [Trichinella spiralis]|uniref:Uncharacterized protein n=1 Tax=Trichinella spiralis TaxID=6334 RepID=A0A0V1AU75_TRISP|nr:hypothetical protein T01_5053 [Trichinella spiralis]
MFANNPITNDAIVLPAVNSWTGDRNWHLGSRFSFASNILSLSVKYWLVAISLFNSASLFNNLKLRIPCFFLNESDCFADHWHLALIV